MTTSAGQNTTSGSRSVLRDAERGGRVAWGGGRQRVDDEARTELMI